MDATRINIFADRIASNERALDWLRQYGSQLSDRGDSVSVTVCPNLASACTGAKEAAKVLSAYARLSIPEIVSTAIKSCENTIELDREAILAEVRP